MASRHWSPVAVSALRVAPGGPLLRLQPEQLAGRVAGGGLGAAPVGPADALHQPGAVAGRGPAGNLGADREGWVRQGLGAGPIGRAGAAWRRVGRGGDGILQELAGREAGSGLAAGILRTADALDQTFALRARLSRPRSGTGIPGLQHLPGRHRGPIADNHHGAVVQVMDAVPHGSLSAALVAHGAAGARDRRATGCRRAGFQTSHRPAGPGIGRGKSQRTGRRRQPRRRCGKVVGGWAVAWAAVTCIAGEHGPRPGPWVRLEKSLPYLGEQGRGRRAGFASPAGSRSLPRPQSSGPLGSRPHR